MFEIHFGLSENPFMSGHQPRFVYASPEHQEALAHLRFGIENREPFVLITGEVGTGKTTALYDVLIEWKGRVHVALINNSALTRNELLEEICLRLGFNLPQGSTKPQVLSQLERHLLAVHARGERAILLLDEAQNLDRELLEEIRLLSNLELDGEKLLQVFLVGQPELEERLARPELRQLRQRISVHYRLKPLSYSDTEHYIHHRIKVAGGRAEEIFPAVTCRVVFALSHGIPREINHICAQALLGAFVDDARVVLPEHVNAAAAEIEFKSVIPPEGGVAAAPQTVEPRAVVPPPVAAPPPLTPPPVRVPAPEPRVEQVAPPRPEPPERVIELPRPAPPPRVMPPPPPVMPPPPPLAAPRAAPELPRGPLPYRTVEPASRAGAPPPVIEREPAREPVQPRRPSPNTIEELDDDDDSSTGLKWLLAVGALAVIVIAAVMLMRFGPWSGTPRAAAVVPPSPAPAESSAVTSAPQATVAPAPEPTSKAPAEVTPQPTPPMATAAAEAPKPMASAVVPPNPPRQVPAESTHAPIASPGRVFCVAVATFLDEGRAQVERTRLEASTKMSARVRTIVADSVSRYELILGSFTSRNDAERAASDLIARGLVDEARVVSRAQATAPAVAPH